MLVNTARSSLSRLIGEYPATDLFQPRYLICGWAPDPDDTPLPVPDFSNSDLWSDTSHRQSYDITQQGLCSINADVYYDQPLCINASGTWTPDQNRVNYYPQLSPNYTNFNIIVPPLQWYDTQDPSRPIYIKELGLYGANNRMLTHYVLPAPLYKPFNRRIFVTWNIYF